MVWWLLKLIAAEFRLHECSQILSSKVFSSLFVATEMSLLLWSQNAWQSMGSSFHFKGSVQSRRLFGSESSAGRLASRFSCTFHFTLSLSYLCCMLRNHHCPHIMVQMTFENLGSLPFATTLFSSGVCPGLCILSSLYSWAFSCRWEATLCSFMMQALLEKCFYGNPRLTSSNSIQMLLTTEAFFFLL